MVELLSRVFIKNRQETDDPEVRRAYGVLCGVVGITLNILVSVAKFIAGLLSSSVAIMADAGNNLSDAASSIVVLIGFKLSGKKADSDHPFGHGRIEYISGLIVSMLIILMAFELAKSAFDKIIHPEVAESSLLIICILAGSILVKLYMFLYNSVISKRIKSAAMGATAKDSISDTFATGAVLICTIIGSYFGIPLDGYCGILVSLLVFKAGFDSVRDTMDPLLGMSPDPEFVHGVEELILSHDGILGVHDLVVHDYGPGRVFVSAHAEVSADGNLLELHDLIDNIEHDLETEMKCEAVLHMDPICNNDEETNRLKKIVGDIIEEFDECFRFHDFRIVKGPTHTNVVFDLVVPFDYKMDEKEIVDIISVELANECPHTFAVIKVDKDYSNITKSEK